MSATVNDPIDEPARFGSPSRLLDVTPWETLVEGSAFECRVVVCPEEEGGYSAHALRLPGVISQGDSVEEALCNIEDAFRETVVSYREDNLDVPWAPVDVDRPAGSIERWTLVNV
ncbi:MAG: type II toxin-antitoxin system HicB family antitoxin [Candidatus Nealsonbacteria bacterium]|nr:type II toxin-antitoxin system HicB family antitoxin [Candidatus Nealsonbacteria bacterium]